MLGYSFTQIVSVTHYVASSEVEYTPNSSDSCSISLCHRYGANTVVVTPIVRRYVHLLWYCSGTVRALGGSRDIIAHCTLTCDTVHIKTGISCNSFGTNCVSPCLQFFWMHHVPILCSLVYKRPKHPLCFFVPPGARIFPRAVSYIRLWSSHDSHQRKCTDRPTIVTPSPHPHNRKL